MSHLTTYNSNVLVNCKKGILTKAVNDLGYSVDFETKTIRNTWINEEVDAGLYKDGKALSVGFRFNKEGKNEVLTLAGDFYMTGINQNTFIDELSQMYKKHDVIAQCKKQGWTVNKSDVKIDSKTNEVVITASRYTA